jgi:hypothetical protein
VRKAFQIIILHYSGHGQGNSIFLSINDIASELSAGLCQLTNYEDISIINWSLDGCIALLIKNYC